MIRIAAAERQQQRIDRLDDRFEKRVAKDDECAVHRAGFYCA